MYTDEPIEMSDMALAIRDKDIEIEKLKKEVVHWREARRSCIEAGDMMKAEIDKLRALVVRAADFCDYAGITGDVLEYGIRCCCGTRDFEAHRKGCEYGEEVAKR
jgi:hypothetical protein